MSVSTPYQFAQRGNLFIVPVGPSIADAPYPTQSFTKPPEYSLWVHGKIQEPGLHLDEARMSPRLYQEVRADLMRYSPVEVTRSAFRRAERAYVGVIDSRGTPYYFALDSRGVSVREAPVEAAWKAYDSLAEQEHMAAVHQRRAEAAKEMRMVDRELSEPTLVVTKGLKYGKKTDWTHDVPHSTWWRNTKRKKALKDGAPADDGDVTEKALPRKSKEEGVKKTPSRKASKKQAGATGRVRYTYPQEGKGAGGKTVGQQQVPLVVVHDDMKHADPSELANQLGVSIRTLQRCARRLGSDGFAKFMRAHLRRFATKHRLDPDYWGTLYANLVAGDVVAKSDHEAAWKQFGDNVKEAASAVPSDHPGRFGDHKVFIHHVHHEMKRHGTYSGNLDEFKRHVITAHQKQHLVAARADLVSAMDPHSVKQSEARHSEGAIYHFIDHVKHDPEAAKKLSGSHPAVEHVESKSPAPETKTKVKKDKPKLGLHHEIAHLASGEAHEATAHAMKMNTKEAHLAAMTAHHKAGVAHQKATNNVNDKTALRHFDHSVAHATASKKSV